MPPRKEPLNAERYQALLEEYAIHFEGPVRPKHWPAQYQHHFSAIRHIWSNRYDDYRGRNRQQRELVKRRATRLRDKAYAFRQDIKVNESTWRHNCENEVGKQFEDAVICNLCNGELCQSDYEALTQDEEFNEFLKAKRKERTLCCCRGRSHPKERNRDDEYGQIFRFSASTRITHDPNDDLHNTSVSMSPDRVIGLTRTPKLGREISSFPHTVDHEPVDGQKSIIHPFLIIEAKKDKDTPGFRFIERQTAFPLRRILKIQYDLQRLSGLKRDPPLAWFFAFQGEEWRLYGATHDSENEIGPFRMRVYDLWHGTIESHDGALQLVQIIDYIWTWARDIYRPQVTDSLRMERLASRSPSPAMEDRYRQFSIMTEISHPSQITPTDDRQQHVHSNDEVQDSMDFESAEPVFFDLPYAASADAHPFLRWAIGHRDAPSWTVEQTIRHTDIVKFSIQFLTVHDQNQLQRHWVELGQDFNHGTLNELYNCRFAIQKAELTSLELAWTGTCTFGYSGLNETICVSLFFSTYCQDHDWQIMRQLSCIIWPVTAGQEFQVPYDDLISSANQLQQIIGKSSALLALQNTTLAIQAGATLRWEVPELPSFSGGTDRRIWDLFDWLSTTEGEAGLSLHQSPARLLYITPSRIDTSFNAYVDTITTDWEQWEQCEGIVAMKEDDRPLDCPKFCFFATLRDSVFRKEALAHTLYLTMKQQKIFRTVDDRNVSDEDRSKLSSWKNKVLTS